MRRLGLSPRRPLVRAYEQDPERMRRWKEQEYPGIHAEAAAAGATIFFGDEAGVRTDYHSGTTWAPVGRTPVVRGTGARLSVNMISAQGGMHFSFIEGNTNAARFIDYLTKLLHDIPGKIFLIVDGHSAHTAAATKRYVASTEGRLRLFYLRCIGPGPARTQWSVDHCDSTLDLLGQLGDELVKRLGDDLLEVADHSSLGLSSRLIL